MNKKKWLPWVRTVVLCLVGLILGVRVFHWNASTLGGNQLPMPFGFGTAVVMSGSMEPTLSVNDLVIVREADSYELDDIVVYQSDSSLVIHRVVEKQEEMITAQGDANPSADEPIHQRYVKGKLVMVIPAIGGAVRVLKSLPGMITLLVVAVVLLELSWRKEKSGDDQQMDAIKDEIKALKKELEEQETKNKEGA